MALGDSKPEARAIPSATIVDTASFYGLECSLEALGKPVKFCLEIGAGGRPSYIINGKPVERAKVQAALIALGIPTKVWRGVM